MNTIRLAQVTGNDTDFKTTLTSDDDRGPFFARLGLSELQRESMPAALLATRRLSSLCPSSATIMKLIKPPT